MSSPGDEQPKWLTSSPRGDIADIDLLRLLAEFFAFDAVVLIMAGVGPTKVRVSWPINQADTPCDDSTTSEQECLLRAAGGDGKNILSATATIDFGMAVRIHCSFVEPLQFTQERVERALETLIRLFAAQLNADLSRRRAEELNTRLTALVDLSLALGQGLGLTEHLQRIVESARLMLGARYAALGVLEESGTGLGQIVTAGLDHEQQVAIGNLPQGHGLLGNLMRDAQVVRLEHLAQDPRSVGFPRHHPPMDSFLGVPVIIHNVVLGSLYLTDKESGPFTVEDERVAVSFALQAAVAVEIVRIYDSEHKRANMLESVQEIENAIQATSDTQQALDVLCSMVGQKLNVDRVKTNAVGDSHEVKFGAQWYLPSQQPLRNILDDLSPHAGQVVDDLWQTSGLRVIDDFSARLDLSEGSKIFHEFTGAHAAIIVPIELGGRNIGVIYVMMNHQPRHWTELETELVKRVAKFVAHVIENAEYRIRQSEHIEQLEQLKRQQSNFVATVSHELRTPLTSIIGYLELLRDGDGNEFSTDQLGMLEVMGRNSVRLRKLIEDLLVLNRKESDLNEVMFADVNMCALTIETCQEVLLVAQTGSITLDIDAESEDAIVLGDKEQLKSAVANIVSNAIKFSLPGSTVNIRCVSDRKLGQVHFSCRDRGIGIPLDDQKQLFNRFYRASNATRDVIPGTGLGLSIVKQIVHDHGGEVLLTSAEGEGTTVIIDLPLAANSLT